MRTHPEIEIKDVQTGDIMLECTRGIIPSIIHFFQFLWYFTIRKRTPLYAWLFNHMGLFNTQHGFLHISESVARGVVNSPIWMKRTRSVKRLLVGKLNRPLTTDQENYLNMYAVGNVAKHKYGFLQLFIVYPVYIVIKVLWGKTVWIERLAKGKPCGEWVAISINTVIPIFSNPGRFIPIEAMSYDEFSWFELKL